MKKLRLAVVLAFLIGAITPIYAEKRFGRDVVKVSNPKQYVRFKLDDVTYSGLNRAGLMVSVLVYRGTEFYYVEIGLSNKTNKAVTVAPDFVEFVKPNYSVIRTDTISAANELATASSQRFIPVPPPYVPPSSATTTFNASASTFGNQTQINGTATTYVDNSGQAGANFGNALGNAIAARRFYRAQSEAVNLARFLSIFAQPSEPILLQPGDSRIIACTFEQLKHKKAPFDVRIHLSGEDFVFNFKE